MKNYTPDQVTLMIKLRYGGLPARKDAACYVSYSKLGKIFGCSRQLVQRLIFARFEEEEASKLPLIEQMKRRRAKEDRQNWGF